MNQCPICSKSFPINELEPHIDLCLSLPNKNSSPAISNKDNKNPKIMGKMKTDATEEQNRFDYKQLEKELRKIKLAMKGIRDIVIKKDKDFHCSNKNLYNKIDNDIKLFLNGFNQFRKKFDLIDEPIKKDQMKQENLLEINELDHKILPNKKNPIVGDSKTNNTDIIERGNDMNENGSVSVSEQNDQIINEEIFGRQLYRNKKTIETAKKQKKQNNQNAHFDKIFKHDDDIGKKNQNSQQKNQPQIPFDKFHNKNETLKCAVCNRQMIEEALIKNKCEHKTCQFCISETLIRRIEEKFYENNKLQCLKNGCNAEMPWLFSSFIQNNLLEQFSEQQMVFLTKSDSFINCPKCSHTFYKEDGDENELIQTFNGVALSEEASRDLVKNRFRCSQCKTEFCASCDSVPYHKGRTCEQFSFYRAAPKCRLCKSELVPAQIDGICAKKECRERDEISCKEQLPCGHRCLGTENHAEKKGPGCLVEDCASHIEKKLKVKSEDFCQICWVESLGAAPVVLLGCGHVFHSECVKTKLDKKWPSARITFGYLNCPLCKKLMDLKSEPALRSVFETEKTFFLKIREMAFKRIDLEGLRNDPKLSNKDSHYYNRPHEFAMHRFAFYFCSKCEKPYFGGMRNCEEALREVSENFNKSHLVCGPCSSGKNAKSCEIHGNDFITFKCKFCCGVANWFCWDTTHFCDKCHKKQVVGKSMSRKKISQLPKCKGKETCPLKVDHPPNGVEYSLGCVVCLRK
ncbi:hypothetical protein MHBO_001344 [Bonamia ostreae]|uniref:RING-type domain-containing protein n=1 Tax=Bonamia ostreae TaxID=126728 RepID=A0ABV2AJ97_9EUKA